MDFTYPPGCPSMRDIAREQEVAIGHIWMYDDAVQWVDFAIDGIALKERMQELMVAIVWIIVCIIIVIRRKILKFVQGLSASMH